MGEIRPAPWAEQWHETTFDYGNEIGFRADVGPFRQAIRTATTICIREPEYRDGRWKLRLLFSRHPPSVTLRLDRAKVLVRQGQWKDVDIEESEVWMMLEDWFKARALDCRDFLWRADERGW